MDHVLCPDALVRPNRLHAFFNVGWKTPHDTLSR